MNIPKKLITIKILSFSSPTASLKYLVNFAIIFLPILKVKYIPNVPATVSMSTILLFNPSIIVFMLIVLVNNKKGINCKIICHVS